VVACLSIGTGLGDATLWEPDEPRFAEATRQMFARGDFITPYLNGVPRFEKPILLYWLQAGAAAAFGHNEFAARVPAALAGIVTVVLVYLLTARLASPSAGLYAALVLATTFRFVTYARQGLTDVPVLCFIVATLYGFQRAVAEPRARTWALAAWACVGLGVLMKGPVGVLALIVWGSHALLRRDWSLVTRIRPLPGVPLAIAIVIPWYVVMMAKHGDAFMNFAIGHEIVSRVVSEESFAPSRGWSYYLKVFPGDAAPWSLVFIAGVLWCVRRWRDLDAGARLAIGFACTWFVTVIVTFSVSRSKVPHYILPAYPAAALLIGVVVDRLRATAADGLYWRTPFAIIAAAVAIAAAMAALFVRTLLPASSIAVQWLLPGALGLGAVVLAYAAVAREVTASVQTLAWTLAVSFAVIATVIVPRAIEPYKPMPALARRIAQLAPAGSDVGLLGRYGASTLIYYSGHNVRWLDDDDAAVAFHTTEPRALCVMPATDYERLAPRLAGTRAVAMAEEFNVRIERLLEREKTPGRQWVLVGAPSPAH
jgi:4-amino-4-deoxy-L-arabinose transferase-like glycosyltransferase